MVTRHKIQVASGKNKTTMIHTAIPLNPKMVCITKSPIQFHGFLLFLTSKYPSATFLPLPLTEIVFLLL